MATVIIFIIALVICKVLLGLVTGILRNVYDLCNFVFHIVRGICTIILKILKGLVYPFRMLWCRYHRKHPPIKPNRISKQPI